jgi:hypothetical protein
MTDEPTQPVWMVTPHCEQQPITELSDKALARYAHNRAKRLRKAIYEMLMTQKEMMRRGLEKPAWVMKDIFSIVQIATCIALNIYNGVAKGEEEE